MFFNKIEMSGFKSFANRTTINFPPGRTVIVGPNGCGKSNILDAVRWVLGSQSPKSLRGSKMNDVIFAGSESTKAMGYAQVSLYLSNEDGRLPFDLSEVCVTRRLFSSGESEYLINKIPCRLKDITELFMDTGIGKLSYSILEQGNVDEIVKAKPPERRYLFEEAAGIARYKAKREEAQRKLIKTEENLLRLADIIAEVKRNSISLKRQATRAERYNELITDLKRLEQHLLVLRYNGLIEEKTTLIEDLRRLQETISGIANEIERLSREDREKEAAREEYTQKSNDAQQTKFDVSSRLNEVSNRVSVYKERRAHIEKQKTFLSDELSSLEKQKEEAKTRLEEIVRSVSEQKQQILEQEVEYKTLKERHTEVLSHIDSLSTQITQTNEALSGLKVEESDLTHEKSHYEQIIRRIEEDIATIEIEEHELGERLQRLETLREEKQNSLTTIESFLEERKRSLDEIDTVLTEKERERDALNDKITRGEKQLGGIESRLRTLRELEERLEGYNKGVREVMSAAKEGSLQGIVGVVASLLEVEEEHRAAIESILESRQQDVVVRSASEAEQSIRYLTQNDLGRATFLSLDLISTNGGNGHVNKALHHDGVICTVDTLARVPDDIAPVIKHLLGNVLMVENLETGRRLHNDGLRLDCVTPEGVFLSERGALRGGRETGPGLIQRSGEIRALSQEVETLSSSLGTERESIAFVHDEIAELKREREALAAELHQKEIELERGRKDVQATRTEIEKENGARARLNEAKDVKRREIEDIQRSIQSLDAKVSEIKERIASKEALFKELKEKDAVLSDEEQKVSERIAELLADLSRNRERYHATEEKHTHLSSEIQRIATNITDKNERMVTLSSEKKEIEESIKENEEKITDLVQEKETLEREIERLMRQREQASLDLKNVQNQLQTYQRDQNEHENALHEKEITKAQLDLEEKKLEEESEEKYGVTITKVLDETGEITKEREEIITEISQIRDKIQLCGQINPTAIEEYNQLRERYEFLRKQEKDLIDAKAQLEQTIKTLDANSKKMFAESFEKIQANFRDTFRRLFNGGKADLLLVDEEGADENGIEIVAQPPGKKLQSISLLSGGEKALTAISLLLAIFLYKPSPFCILDEIDAPLDDANVERFKKLIDEFTLTVQFILITHNKQTMKLADTLYGITMEEAGVSRVVSVKFDEVDKLELDAG